MEYDKINNLLGSESEQLSKFVSRQYVRVNILSNTYNEHADDLDIVMPMYNLLEYSKNYKKTVGSLYNYHRDELSNDNDDNNFGNIKVVNSGTFKYKNKITGNTYNVDSTIVAGGARIANPNYDANNSGKENVELAIPLKYLGDFWRALNMPLISYELSLEL